MIVRVIFWVLAFHMGLDGGVLEQFKDAGYVEMRQEDESFDALYTRFDGMIDFLQNNPVWAQRLYGAKERFIRSKERSFYSTDFFGFFDEAEREGRNQIAFYYSSHFHTFIAPQFSKVPEIMDFLEACREMQTFYENRVYEVAEELDLNVSILFKVIKYFPSYAVTRPHYDGSAFSLFLNSSDNESLLISPYKESLSVVEFFSPKRENSILAIPGTQLTEFSIYPTPHIVVKSGKTRYASIAFAMRPNYTPHRMEFALLPNFN